MTLSAGTRLGPYEIQSSIGIGGMGEVYRAKDTRLERTVAIKILPSELSSDSESKQRFDREARTISSLSHPNICALYDVGHDDGFDFLVMEFLEGETLAARISKGALPVDQIVRYGMEIADALDTAHSKGVIHRDLKPANIMLTKTGAKLLDFGLAKLARPQTESGVLDLPTEQHQLTARGYILGTIQYMSPEQLEAKEVDTRTDIFSFGLVLYEMATGRKAFIGSSPASLISAILTSEPPTISSLRPIVPDVLDRIVQACLAKNREDRWQTAHDVVLQLKWMERKSSFGNISALTRPFSKKSLAWILATLFFLTSVFLAIAFYRSMNKVQPEITPSLQRLSIVLPENFALNSSAISPDGQRLAYVINGTSGLSTMWLRYMDTGQAEEIPGTEDATLPFWSPDSRSIGFFTERELKKFMIGGGPPETLCAVDIPKGGAWNQFGDIIFSPRSGAGLYRISARGGEATPLTTLDTSKGEWRQSFPQFLPDGRHYLYMNPAPPDYGGVYVGSLDSKERKRILPDSIPVRYVEPGYILFTRGNKLLAQQFDKNRFELNGDPVAIASNDSDRTSGPNFSVSNNNVLLYTNLALWKSQPIWFDRSGKQSSPVKNYPTVLGEPSEYRFCDLSMDNKRFMIVQYSQMWMVDLTNNSFDRFAMTEESDTVFSPDGTQVVYSDFSNTIEGEHGLYLRPSNGSGKTQMLYHPESGIQNLRWSFDGKFITFTGFNAETRYDVWVLPLIGERKAFPYLQTEAREESATLSPDGKWMAYQSDESGQVEVYVRSFPLEAGGKWQISTSGGEQPIWRSDGKELFYLTLDKQLMAIEVLTGEIFKPGTAQLLFQTHIEPRINPWGIASFKQYFVSNDGKHFLVNSMIDMDTPVEITVLLNWKSLLKH